MTSQLGRTVVFLLLTSVSGPASAEPISAVYKINVKEYCTEECVPMNVVFPLTLTFDSRHIFEQVTPTSHQVYYGAPTFAGIPFERPAVDPRATEIRYTSDYSFLLGAPGLPPWRRLSTAQHSQQFELDGILYRWNLYLSAGADTQTPAELGDARAFARFLGTQGPDEDGDPNDAGSFLFGFVAVDRQNSLRLPGAVHYLGVPELQEDVPAVPEPSTLALLGTALAGAAFEKYRRRSRQGEGQP